MTAYGITYTPNADGSVTANGTATSDARCAIAIPKLNPNTEYILSGGLSENCRLYYRYSNNYAWDFGAGAAFTTPDEVSKIDMAHIMIMSGTTVENAVFKPMIRLASDADATYEPYQGETFALEFGTNLLKNTATTQTVNGITYTVNADGSVRANGTATANAYFYIDAAADSFEVGKEYKISGCPAGGSTSSYRVLFQYVNASGALTFPANDMGSGGHFTCGEALKTPQYVIVVAGGTTVSNLIFHPAIYDTEEATVYGGTLDWNKGEMVVDMGGKAFDGTEPFSDGGNVYFLNASYVPGIELGFLNENPNAKAYCSHFTQGAGGINDAAAVGKFDLGGSIRFNKSGFTTVDDFKAYLAAQYAAGTPVQIAYTLAEPITVKLAPQQITALAGLNTLYGDADEMTVQYNKSLNAAFEELKNAILAMGGNV